MLPDDPRNLVMLWRASVRHHVPRTRDALLRLTAATFQQVFDPIQLLFYLAVPPPEIEPLRLIPCLAREMSPGLFVCDGSSAGSFFYFGTDHPHYAFLALSRQSLGLLFLEYTDRPFTEPERRLIDLIAVRLARHLSQLPDAEEQPGRQPLPLFVDEMSGHVWIAGRLVYLSPGERTLMQLLYKQFDRPCDRRLIQQALYGDEHSFEANREDRRLEQMVSRLRQKLEKVPGSRVVIKRVRGVGYRLTLSK